MSADQNPSQHAPRPSRRKCERIRLEEPIRAQLGGTPVTLNDVSMSGAGVEHQNSLQVGAKGRLSFAWNGETINVSCTVLRCKLVGFVTGRDRAAVYATGVAFDGADVTPDHPIRQMIEACVRRALDEQIANARGTGSHAPLLQGDGKKASRDAGYISLRFDKGRWRKAKTQNPEQPAEGFTVRAAEDPDQLDLLCALYEKSEDAMRTMIRLLAQLSVMEGSDESHRRYIP
ncbi:MAG: PilZ domain-containing protein [Thermoanaerobaculia bacterium]